MEPQIQRIGELPTNEELVRAIKNRKIPVKYCYLNSGANAWHKLRQSNEYRLGKRENTILTRSLCEVEKILGNSQRNLVHLGVGDGIEIPKFLDVLSLSGRGRYAGVDVSEQMIRNANSLNEIHFSTIQPLWYLSDIEEENNLESVCRDVKSKGANRNVLLLTNEGSLLSNKSILKLLRDSLGSQDYLFITLEGDNFNNREEILKTYSLPKTLELLSVGLQKAGYNSIKEDFSTLFNEAKSRAEVHFKPKGEEPILCLASYKPKGEEFRKRLTKSGFDIQYFEFYEDIHSFAVLCKKKGE